MNTKRAPDFRPVPPRIHPVTHWHRILGIVSTLIVLITVITGLVLNHSDVFDLSEKRVVSAVVRYLYGHRDPQITSAYFTTRGWVTQLNTRVFLDIAEIFQRQALLVGAVETQDGFVIAFTDGIVEFDQAFDVVERYGALDGIKTPVRQIGVLAGAPVINTAAGLLQFDVLAGALEAASADAAPEWQTSAVLPAALRDELVVNYGGPGVSYEQLLLDLHSGRLFGLTGVIIVDVAAICLLLLAVSGIYLYFKFKRNALPPPPP